MEKIRRLSTYSVLILLIENEDQKKTEKTTGCFIWVSSSID